MTKQELIKTIAVKANLTLIQAEKALTILQDTIAEELRATGEFKLPNVAIFKVVDKPARVGRNPHTGEAMNVPAGKRISVKVSKNLKDAAL